MLQPNAAWYLFAILISVLPTLGTNMHVNVTGQV